MPTKSEIFRAYNYARISLKYDVRVTKRRLDRALGLLLSGRIAERQAMYHTTIEKCHCMDSYRTTYCKHRLALMLEFRANNPLSREAVEELKRAREDMAGKLEVK